MAMGESAGGAAEGQAESCGTEPQAKGPKRDPKI